MKNGNSSAKRKEEELYAIIEEDKLKPEETRRFIANAFRDGVLNNRYRNRWNYAAYICFGDDAL